MSFCGDVNRCTGHTRDTETSSQMEKSVSVRNEDVPVATAVRLDDRETEGYQPLVVAPHD